MGKWSEKFNLSQVALLLVVLALFLKNEPEVDLFGTPVSVVMLAGVALALGSFLYLVLVTAPNDRARRDERDRVRRRDAEESVE